MKSHYPTIPAPSSRRPRPLCALPCKALWAVTAMLALSALPAAAQRDKEPEYANTIRVEAGDTPERIIEKAVHVVPTDNQMEAMEREFIAFAHFGPNTFTRKEWGNGMEDPSVFDLRELDTDQWCSAMAAAGIKLVILTAKHHDGFVLWQSRYTKHGIMSSPFRDGKGDVLRDLSASCRKYGLKLGIYLSPADLYQIESPEGLYGNGSAYTRRTIPREVPGRPFRNKTKFEFVVDDYNEYFLNQLFELLTEYGPIHEVWFDGAHPKRKGGQRYNYTAWRQLIRTLAPQAVIYGREDVRWCGNESGATRPTEWNVIPYEADPDTMQVFADLTEADLGSREQLYKKAGAYLHYQPSETDTSIREGWFYRDDDRQGVRSADDVFDIYERSVGGNSIFLLNIPPNREGRLSDRDVEVLHEVGRRIRDTYGNNLLSKADGPKALLDDDDDTFIELPGGSLEIKLPQAIRLNRFAIQEAVRLRGERIEAHALDVWTDGAWKEVARATNVGYKRILRFAPVTTDRLRLRVLQTRATPAICQVSAHYCEPRPPRLTVTRSLEGDVTIAPRAEAFGWKPHGEDIAANLNAGYAIHYTTDGSEPDETSPVYTGPFRMDRGEVNAIAMLDGKSGELCHEDFGYAKAGWKAEGAAAADEAHAPGAAIDADPATCWLPADGTAQTLTIDMGTTRTLCGFDYTPPTDGKAALMAAGTVEWSADGKKWEKAGDFEFGNLKNDPTRRSHDFGKKVKARYIRFRATAATQPGQPAAIAEIDLR